MSLPLSTKRSSPHDNNLSGLIETAAYPPVLFHIHLVAPSSPTGRIPLRGDAQLEVKNKSCFEFEGRHFYWWKCHRCRCKCLTAGDKRSNAETMDASSLTSQTHRSHTWSSVSLGVEIVKSCIELPPCPSSCTDEELLLMLSCPETFLLAALFSGAGLIDLEVSRYSKKFQS